MNKFKKKLIRLIDIFLVPFVYPSAWLLKKIRKVGIQRLPACKNVLLNVGVFPIRRYYHEPEFDMRGKKRPFSEERYLPGIDWNMHEQLEILGQLTFSEEVTDFPMGKTDILQFYYKNGAFESGDAEYWYQLVRLKKPKRIFEVGSGHSTLMAMNAIRKNRNENPDYNCKHVCVEPYEAAWLEDTTASVIRQKVEDVDISFFLELEKDDILFIDSSHVIKPEGDVLFEYLEVLPQLNKGVIVHVHDVFSPRNYLDEWLTSEIRLWNEQYLLEAFLSHNNSWKIIGSLNYLLHNHYEALKVVCPLVTISREPGSFYIQKNV